MFQRTEAPKCIDYIKLQTCQEIAERGDGDVQTTLRNEHRMSIKRDISKEEMQQREKEFLKDQQQHSAYRSRKEPVGI